MINRDKAIGWKEIALVLGVNERNARRAYTRDRDVRRAIHKTGGRYWAGTGDLMSTWPSATTMERPRNAKGRYRKKTRGAI